MNKIIKYFDLKLVLVFVAVLFLYTLFILRGDFAGDFWEHAAVINKFASNDPGHPLLSIEADHSFYNPYLILLGFITKLPGLTPISTLCIAGYLNLLFLFFSLSKLLRSLNFSRNAVFFSFLFLLILWEIPYDHSGFISLNIINYTLPYPSTFCLALTFYLLYLFNTKEHKSGIFYTMLSLGIAVTVITHLVTGISLIAGLIAFSLNNYRLKHFRQYCFLAMAVFAALVLSFLWPYYSMYELVTGAGKIYNESNKKMYVNVFDRTLPALYILPFLVYFLFVEKNKSLSLMFIMLCAFYAYGYLTEQWSYGRVLAIMMIILHAKMGHALGIVTDYFKDSVLVMSVITIFIICISIKYTRDTAAINPLLFGNERHIVYNKYDFLKSSTHYGNVIFSDQASSWPIPALGRKIVACDHVQAFVPDDEKRRKDTELFFGKNPLPDSLRTMILYNYHVNYILVSKGLETTSDFDRYIQHYSSLITENTYFRLYSFAPEKH